MAQAWLSRYPEHPDVLELTVDLTLEKAGNRPSEEMVPLLERYARARPVDPKPRRLLAQLFLSRPDAASATAVIENLEFLDAREQKLTVYATELARRYFARSQASGEGAEDLQRALVKAERATQLAPYEAPPRELAATIAIKAGELDRAERHIRALTILEPSRDIHRQRLGALEKMKRTPR
jgi:Flp pilus assembly protein TadD